jgi:hypothetical protein
MPPGFSAAAIAASTASKIVHKMEKVERQHRVERAIRRGIGRVAPREAHIGHACLGAPPPGDRQHPVGEIRRHNRARGSRQA